MKLTCYFGERSRVSGRLLADELLDRCERNGIRTSVLLRAIQGFGAKQRLRSDRLLTLSEDLPLVVVALDERERIEALLANLGASDLGAGIAGAATAGMDKQVAGAGKTPSGMGGAGQLLTVERAWIGDASALEAADGEVKLTVYLGRHRRIGADSGFLSVSRVLHEQGAAGATVLLGVDGTLNGERRRARFFAGNADVPLIVTSVGQPEPLARALRRLLAFEPTLSFTIERVRVCKRSGELLRHPGDEPTATPTATTALHHRKLTVITSEAARRDGKPVYLELIRRLRAAGAAGATCLRGIWGFHGDHAPHGDRLLALRRHVPVVIELIDSATRVAELFAIVDELTHEQGLVTSELVPQTWHCSIVGAALRL